MKIKASTLGGIAILAAVSFAACGKKDDSVSDKKNDKNKPVAAALEPAARTHTEIGEEISAVIDKLIIGAAEMKDIDSAKAFAVSSTEDKQRLKDLLAAAKKLDPPTAEDQVALQILKDAIDAKNEKLLSIMMPRFALSDNNRDTAIVISKAYPGIIITEIKDGLVELYDLQDMEKASEEREAKARAEARRLGLPEFTPVPHKPK